ncbi:MAG: imidazoleglycerol-phosphate dehydratase HisB, partial [Methylocella sp.]
TAPIDFLARMARMMVSLPPWKEGAGARFLFSGDELGMTVAETTACAREIAPALLVVDESLIEFDEAPSLASIAATLPNIIVVRSLLAYGLAGAPCGAMIANPSLVARLEEVCEPDPLPAPVVKLAEAALAPNLVAANARRIALVKAERARLFNALQSAPDIHNARPCRGPFLNLTPRDEQAMRANIGKFAVQGAWRGDGTFRLEVRDPATNDLALRALGAACSNRPRRRAEIMRETLETRIVVALDLDTPEEISINTGVGFYDHMLTQVAAHGGFSLFLACKGDLEVDAHHTIEDCGLALGQALRTALGDRRGIARFGFVLPMDEAEAKISLDLGGRPYLVFDAAFTAPMLGAYPTGMTGHFFRSLAQSLGAAIHLSVTGEDDHHKTEACFKALGRALRQAIQIEGAALPSTKGVIA